MEKPNFDLYLWLSDLRKRKMKFNEAISLIELQAEKYSLKITREEVDGDLHVHVRYENETAICFQPYEDIDRFYFEM